MNGKRRAFTLVELLIVIVVIGILSAMMMLSSTEAVTTAKANNIVANLRNLKTAALAWHADNVFKIDTIGRIKKNNDTGKFNGEFAEDGTNAVIKAKDLLPYINGGGVKLNGNKVVDSYGGQYITDWASSTGKVTEDDNARTWIITYKMPTDNKALKKKLAGRAKSTGLIFKAIKAHGLQTYSYEATEAASTSTNNNVKNAKNDVSMIVVKF